MTAPAFAVERSKNRKIGDASATYASQSTCPGSCPLRGSGCYAETGRMGLHTLRVNGADDQADAADVEAQAIDALTGRLDLRVHVVGDCPDDASARTVSAAMARHGRKAGRRAWTYTHAWRDVERASWADGASVLASCESAADVRDATTRGYATALVVSEHLSERRYTTADGADVIPCPEQSRGIACVDCRLCLRPREAGAPSIAFAIHGASKARALRAIT